jgi:hypothetical protein
VHLPAGGRRVKHTDESHVSVGTHDVLFVANQGVKAARRQCMGLAVDQIFDSPVPSMQYTASRWLAYHSVILVSAGITVSESISGVS